MSIHAAWTKPISNEIWALSSGSVNHRWLVIHNLASAVEDGVYHIEVMERSSGEKPWQFRHLAKHMAISEEALRASLIKPMKRGAVYPETFNDAFSQWKKQSVEVQADCVSNHSGGLSEISATAPGITRPPLLPVALFPSFRV